MDYEASESEEDGPSLLNNSKESSTSTASEGTDAKACGSSEFFRVSLKKGSVPLGEHEDFESRISCTTIEKNLDGKNGESGEKRNEERESGKSKPRELNNLVSLTSGFSSNHFPIDRSTLQTKESLLANNVVFKKLVTDKTVAIKRSVDELETSSLKKNSELKSYKAKTCDKSEESNKGVSIPCILAKNNVVSNKRTYQALKSVRITKKAERNLEFTEKRPKLNET